MRTTIDETGHVVPERILERLQLVGPAEVEIDEQDGLVVIRPLPGEVRIVETPDGPVAVSSRTAALTDEIARHTLEHVRE